LANWLAGNAVVDQHLDCFTDQVRTPLRGDCYHACMTAILFE